MVDFQQRFSMRARARVRIRGQAKTHLFFSREEAFKKPHGTHELVKEARQGHGMSWVYAERLTCV